MINDIYIAILEIYSNFCSKFTLRATHRGYIIHKVGLAQLMFDGDEGSSHMLPLRRLQEAVEDLDFSHLNRRELTNMLNEERPRISPEDRRLLDFLIHRHNLEKVVYNRCMAGAATATVSVVLALAYITYSFIRGNVPF